MSKSSEKKQARLAVRLATGVATTGVALALFAGTAGAAPTSLAPISDYASYPAAHPAGCPDGADALVGLSFSNGRGGEASDLRKLPLRSGDTLTMTWTGLAPGCVSPSGDALVDISLVVYRTQQTHFDMFADETLVDSVSWSGAGAGQLVVTVPSMEDLGGGCHLQIDAVLGAPLVTVGPNGSYYSSIPRNDDGPDNLISAANFDADCVVPETPAAPPVTEAPAPPAPEAPAPEVVETPAPEEVVETPAPEAPPVVEATQATTPTTAAPAPAPAPAPEVTAATAAPEVAAAPATTAPVEVLGVNVSRQAAPTSGGRLPFTGAATGLIAALGAALLGTGAIVRRGGQSLRRG